MVRKAFAILLLALFLFNVVGYKIVVLLQEQQADTRLEALLNKNDYQREDLFTLKIALNLPYQSSQTNFERVDGEITVNNETYKFVQRKVANDTLYLQCIRHTEKINLEQRASDYFGKINDVTGNDATKSSSGKHAATATYTPQDLIDNFSSWSCPAFSAPLPAYFIAAFGVKGDGHLKQLIKPPELA